MMKTRALALLVVLVSLVLATPPGIAAQATGKLHRIGILAETPGPHWEVFVSTLRELGHVEGRSITLEWRWSQGGSERFPELAADLVRLRVDLIVTQGTPAARAARAATSTIPIVMAIAADPVRAGLAQSLARPGGNVTGSSSLAHDLHAKQLQLLRELLPGLQRVGVIYDPGNPMHAPALREIESAAETLRVRVDLAEARRPAELEHAVSALGRDRVGAWLIVPSPIFDGPDATAELVRLAEKARVPAIYNKRQFAEAGGLLTYGARFSDFFRRAAVYVDRVLSGVRPQDLPIEQATHFELVVNLKAARALGMNVSPTVLRRVDSLIE